MENNLGEFVREQMESIMDIERKAYQAGYKAGYQAKEEELKDKEDKMVEEMYQIEELRASRV